jgi:endothelin-converting enzyme/putative endopeptidase
MIEGIEASLGRAFADLAWMDDTTRERARGKLAQVTNKIGFPDRWRDYGALRVGGDYLGNMLEATRFEFRRQLDKVGKPVDKKEWGMTPPTVNAYYNPTVNEMVFPAGILQPPFFSRDFPRAMNYGAVGMAMGHELTHGFDDQGRKFDGTGQMREWWEPSVVARFEERAKCVEDLYSGYEVEPGVKVNGKLTLGENIADLGGIKESYGAYKAWEAEHGAPPSPVPGLTNDQLFFLGYAQSWCQLMTPERARLLVSVDPHSPARFRVQGPLASFPAFAQAFSCAPGTPMNPANRCEVW